MTKVVGITGYSGAGKDSLAKTFIEEYGAIQINFADALREMTLAIDPIVSFDTNIPVRYSEVIESGGYTRAKQNFPEVRQFLQRLGTDAVRNVLGEHIWTDAWLKRAEELPEGSFIVATDVRFINEAETIRTAYGHCLGLARPSNPHISETMIVRVNRMGVKPANGHVSDTEVDLVRVDQEVQNDGTLADLADVAHSIHDYFTGRTQA